jgi:hypothetical protein
MMPLILSGNATHQQRFLENRSIGVSGLYSARRFFIKLPVRFGHLTWKIDAQLLALRMGQSIHGAVLL